MMLLPFSKSPNKQFSPVVSLKHHFVDIHLSYFNQELGNVFTVLLPTESFEKNDLLNSIDFVER